MSAQQCVSAHRGESRIGLAGWLIGHTRRLLPPLGVSVLARIANQLLGVALLVIAAAAIVHAAGGRPVSVPALIGWLAGLALAKAALRYLEHYAGHWVAFTSLQRLRELFFARLVPQAPAATQGRAGAELTERATRDIDRIEVFFAHTLPPAVSAIVVPSIALVWLAVTVDGVLAAVLAPFVVVTAVLLPLLAGPTTWRGARLVARRRGELAERLGDDIQGVREVIGFGAEAARLDGLDRADRALVGARSRAAAVQAVRAAATTAVQAAGPIAIVLVAAAASVPVADAVIALAVAIGLWGPARGADDFASGLDAAFAATARIRRVIDAEPVVRDTESPRAQAAARGEPEGVGALIELDAVTFRYPGGDAAAAALDEVSLRFPPATWSAVVGVSGSGKSTLAALLPRGWDPDEGEVRLGGVPLRDIPLDALRRRVSLVSQRPTVLSGTIADSLRLAAPDADDAALRAGLAVAALDDWADGLPRGLATPVRERGLDLSGGQLQRLALARAVVAAPDVLVLDEALSQLDAETARVVRDRLAAHRPDLTVIEITHRADLVPDDAFVAVLDRGRVLERGAAGRLRRAGGAFVRLEARG